VRPVWSLPLDFYFLKVSLLVICTALLFPFVCVCGVDVLDRLFALPSSKNLKKSNAGVK
jgi:hypothetical protein